MSDYISRQAVLSYIDRIMHQGTGKQKSFEFFRKHVEKMTSAQPEIIRCKDCKKRKHCRTTNTWAVAPDDDWYCADGESQKGEEDERA